MKLTFTLADITIGFRFPDNARRVEVLPDTRPLLSDKKPDLVLKAHYDRNRRINLSLILSLISQIARGKIIFLHSCGILDRGSLMLFAGRPGAGKSTMARLWFRQGASILNEDLIILREIDGDFWCYNCPWVRPFGPEPERFRAPLKGIKVNKIFLIKHRRKNRVRRLKRSEAVRQLFTHAQLLSPTSGSRDIVNFLSRLARLTKRVPAYELGFVPNKRVVDFVRRIVWT